MVSTCHPVELKMAYNFTQVLQLMSQQDSCILTAWESLVLQDPKWLDSRVEAFLCTFLEVLQNMSAEEFKVEQVRVFMPLFLMQLQCAKSVGIS